MLKAAALLILMSAFSSVVAQNNDWWKMQDSKQKPTKPAHKEKIEVSYDKFKDIISMRMEMTIDYGVYVGAIASAAGNDYPLQSKVVLITFKLYNERWRCLDGCGVIFLIDGKRLDLGTAENLDRKIGYGNYPAIEKIGIFVKPELFRQIASAKSVEFQAGPDEGTLKSEHLAALRDFAGRMKQ